MNNSMNNSIREAVQQASRLFAKKGIDAPRLNAEVLAQQVLGWSKAKLFAEDGQPFPEDLRDRFESWVQRRLTGEPLQYIVGVQEFYGRDFQVTPAVLIPRPETELLVEQVLKRRNWWQGRKPIAADIGTGSGAIAVTLALEWPQAAVVTVDISPEALRVAQENAERLGARIRLLQGDLLHPVMEAGMRLDVLVSNPPYIPSADIDRLMVEVREYEPRLALDGGTDGLDPYRRIAELLPQIMSGKPPAMVAFEVGVGQAAEVASLIRRHWQGSETDIVQDLQGIDRIVMGWVR